MQRVGILGGTFNPIHVGHLYIGEMAREKLSLDKVLFIPANIPPHKRDGDTIETRHRYAMVKLAIKDNAHFGISDLEIKRGGKSYSIDTVKALRELYPAGTKFFFLIGADHIAALHQWMAVERLAKMVTFAAINRRGCVIKNVKVKVKILDLPELNISSSFLRERLAKGQSVRYLIPDGVIKYIKDKKLYR